MLFMVLASNRHGRALRAALALAALALVVVIAAPAALATPSISTAVAVQAPAAAEASSRQGVSIEFTSPTARVAGPGALVAVRCAGSGSRSCVGTISIEAPGEPAEVAYSIDRGEKSVVVVPLGSRRGIFAGMVSVRTRVVAETVQPSGASVRTARSLRFK